MNLNFQSKNTRGKIDQSKGIISDVSLVTVGDALGHGFAIDAKSLWTVKEAADKCAGGLKVKVNHGTGADAIVGVLRNFRIAGQQVIGDLVLLKSNPFTPRLIEMARQIPDTFGLSISFGYTPEVIDKITFIRVTSLDSCDIVDSPAANPGGLFSALSSKSPDCRACGAPGQVAGLACLICDAPAQGAENRGVRLSDTLHGRDLIVAATAQQLAKKRA